LFVLDRLVIPVVRSVQHFLLYPSMADISNPKLLYLKGGLFLVIGCFAAAILLIENPSLRFAALFGVAVWAFARAYYFAFYVIEHYIDPGYRYAGLWSFASYLMSGRRPNGSRFRKDAQHRPGDTP
jgi:hypothetical protein